jgi:hypothetical protein
VVYEFVDTKGVIRSRKSKKDRQHNGQKKKYKMTNNVLQNNTHKTKDRVTRTPLKSVDMINQFLIKVHNIFPGINFVYASLRHFNPRSGGVKLAKI